MKATTRAVRITRAAWAVGLVLSLSWVGTLWAGAIRATVQAEEPIEKVWAVERRQTKIGVEPKLWPGRIEGERLVVLNLPEGRYDLRFQTASGTVEGWDAAVPASDYEKEQPLPAEARALLLAKLAKDAFAGFEDQVVVLDLQGNVQNVAALVTKLRTRPFAGQSYRMGEWVWRVDRVQWETKDETTWAPYQERPFYALARRKVVESEYRQLRVTYARHLGGIGLTQAQAEVDLGRIVVPRPKAGIRAVNPDGSEIEPVRVKPVATRPAEGELQKN